MIRLIKYKGKKIKVKFQHCSDCYAMYKPNEKVLIINPNLKKKILIKTLFHELWHIICHLNNVDINKIGEERTATLAEQYYELFRQNSKLKKIVYGLPLS